MSNSSKIKFTIIVFLLVVIIGAFMYCNNDNRRSYSDSSDSVEEKLTIERQKHEIEQLRKLLDQSADAIKFWRMYSEDELKRIHAEIEQKLKQP